MLQLIYFMYLSFAMLAVGIAGIVASRHIVLIVLSVEVMFVSSIILLAAAASYTSTLNGDAAAMIIAVWAVAASDVIVLVALYLIIKAKGAKFDVTLFSELKG